MDTSSRTTNAEGVDRKIFLEVYLFFFSLSCEGFWILYRQFGDYLLILGILNILRRMEVCSCLPYILFCSCRQAAVSESGCCEPRRYVYG